MKIEITFTPSFVDFLVTDNHRIFFYVTGVPHDSYTVKNLHESETEYLIISLAGSVISYPLTPELYHSFDQQHHAYDSWKDSIMDSSHD